MCDARRCSTCESLDHRECDEETLRQDEFDEACCVEEVEGESTCHACGGPGVYLGTLGCVVYYRCRNCGVDQSDSTIVGFTIEGD